MLSTSLFQLSFGQESGKKRRALIIGLDGTTGNQLHQIVWKLNRAPELQQLMKAGKYTICESHKDKRCARTHSGPRYQPEFKWKTGPGWTSVVTGTDVWNHEVKDNDHESLRLFSETSQSYPSFLKRIHDHGLKSSAAGVGAFLTSHNGKKLYLGALDYECGATGIGPAVDVDANQSCNLDRRKALDNKDDNRDEKLKDWMVEQIEDPTMDVVMGVFDKIDSAGHGHGFDSNKKYLNAIAVVDSQISKIIKAIKRGTETRNEEWLVVVTSDHGGHRFLLWGQHGSVRNQDEVVPFIITTFGSDHPLRDLVYPVTHMDVHPTVMQWFGIGSNVDGQVQAVD